MARFKKGDIVFFMGDKVKILSVEHGSPGGARAVVGEASPVFYIVERRQDRFGMPEKEALLTDTLLAVSEFNLRGA